MSEICEAPTDSAPNSTDLFTTSSTEFNFGGIRVGTYTSSV